MTSTSLRHAAARCRPLRCVAAALVSLAVGAVGAATAPVCDWQWVASGRSEAFNQFRFVDPEVGFGDDGRCLWRTENGGRNWSRLPCAEAQSPAAREGTGIAAFQFLDRQRGWLLTEDSVLRASRDGGRSWSEQSFAGYIVRAFAFADDRHGWWVGEKPLSGTPDARGVIFATADGGASWREQPTGMATSVRWRLTDVWPISPREAWTLGDGVLLHTLDGGASWQARDLPKLGPRPGARIRFNATGVGVIVPSPVEQFQISVDGGRHWQSRRPPRTAPELDGLVFVDAQQAWASMLGRVFRSGDGGRSWRAVALGKRGAQADADMPAPLHSLQYLEHDGLLWVATGADGFASCQLRLRQGRRG